VFPQDVPFRIPCNPGRALVPAQNISLRIDHEDPVVLHSIDQSLEEMKEFLRFLALGDVNDGGQHELLVERVDRVQAYFDTLLSKTDR